MKKKQTIGLIIGIVGVVLSIYSLYNMKRIADAKGTVNTITSPFSGNPAGDMAGGALKSEASKYDTAVTGMLVGGIILIIVGGVMTCCHCKKNEKH